MKNAEWLCQQLNGFCFSVSTSECIAFLHFALENWWSRIKYDHDGEEKRLYSQILEWPSNSVSAFQSNQLSMKRYDNTNSED